MKFLQIYFSALISHHSTSCVHIWMKLHSSSGQNSSAYHNNYHSSSRDRLYLWRIYTTKKFSHRLPVQNNYSSNAIFSAIKQLVVPSLVSFWRLGPYLFNKHEKIIWWRLFFRDTEPWRDACFKCILAYLEMFLETGNARVPKKPH